MKDNAVRYRFLSLIGEGGFGRVYRARMEAADGFHKDVAVKVISDAEAPEALLQRFRDEAKILGLLRDRAIVGVEPPIRIGGRWAVVMDFVDGVSCGILLERRPIPAGVAVEIVAEVARALHNAFHMQGPEGNALSLIHRDIKPENIQITPTGDVRLLDFGIARAEFKEREFKTRQSFGGTPGYIAPERLNRIEVAEGDVYSLGVVLHELVTGQRPERAVAILDDSVALKGLAEPPGPDVVCAREDDIPATVRQDEDCVAALQLAAWMRLQDHELRPTSRRVETCSLALRRMIDGPSLRDWAETSVPPRAEMAADSWVGRTLAADGDRLPAPTRASGSVRVGGPPRSTTSSLAWGAVIGGGLAMLVAGVGVAAAAAVGAYWMFGPGASPSESVAQPAVPDEEPVAVVPTEGSQQSVEPTPAPTPAQTPAQTPAVSAPPKPTSSTSNPSKAVRVIEAPRAASKEPTKREPKSSALADKIAPTGYILVEVRPAGRSTVRIGRKELGGAGEKLRVAAGKHAVFVKNDDGQELRVTPTVRAGKTTVVCVDFNRGGTCK